MRPRGRLFRKYVLVVGGLVSIALLASGALGLYFSYVEQRSALATVQHEKALAAATRIAGFAEEIERQMAWTAAQSRLEIGAAAMDQRRLEYNRLLKMVQAITEVSYLDAAGREQLRSSRLAIEVVGGGTDFSRDPRFVETRDGGVWWGPVYFRKESEPYMTVAVSNRRNAGVTVAEVNLKFMLDIVSTIRIGRAGLAYVVDRYGTLIAHPDISLVLQKTSLATLEQVRVALAGLREPGLRTGDAIIARDQTGGHVLADYSTIPELGWAVIVEQPLGEAFAPLYASMQRTGLLVIAGIVLSVGVSLLLARRMVTPIQTLREGAARIGAGELEQRLAVRTGDELEALADQFNRMAAQLQESYASLERKVEERTRELSEALEQQTATSAILRVIAASPTDLQPVLDAVAEHATRVCGAYDALLGLAEGQIMRIAAHHGSIGSAGGSYPLTRGTVMGRAIIDGRPVHVHDLAEADEADFPEGRAVARRRGHRTILAAPLMREGAAIGSLAIRRMEVSPFTDKQIALLQTFADQAVIAIENVRLFRELEARTRELARSVEELRALGEVGQAVSSTLDLQRVLTTVVTRAVELSGARGGVIFEFDEVGREFRPTASHGMEPVLIEAIRETPVRLGEGAVGRAAVTRTPAMVEDLTVAGVDVVPRVRELLVRLGYRSLLAVPFATEERIVGGLVTWRREEGRFPDNVVNLLQTFATQSALAIQNARLFAELGEKSRQLEVADRHKSEFLANMSHELRTPLNAIIGFSEVLVERMFGELNDKQDEYLRDIFSSGRHLLSLINDILDLSKIEAGRMELEITRFDLPAALDNALTLVRERAATHGIALAAEVDPRLGEFSGDERKLKQILLNLLSNAVKFTPEGGQIGVRAAPADGAVEIVVRDTGIGIAPEDQEVIFEEFRQVGSDYAKKREGTGLGLALTKRFVELHGGAIRVESEPGKGSTFTFTLREQPWPAS